MLGVAATVGALAWGILAATRLRGPCPLTERLGLGLALGVALELWLPFLLALAFGVRGGGIASLWVTAALVGLEARRNRSGRRSLVAQVRASLAPGQRAGAIALVLATLAFTAFASYLSWTHSLRERPDGLWTAGYGFGDQAMHATFASSFLHGANLAPPVYPLYAGWPMTYPFVPDFEAASLAGLSVTSSGLSLGNAFALSLAVALVALFLLIVSLARRWTGRGAATGLVAAALFFASGGLGAWEIVTKLLGGASFGFELMARDITQIADHGLVLNNVTTGILLPARNAAFGMALGTAALVLWTRLLDEREAGRESRLEGAVGGVLVGLLPMVHTHSFLALALVGAAWALATLPRGWRAALEWRWALVPLGVVALPQVLWVAHGLHGATSFSDWQPGWESDAFASLIEPKATGLGPGAHVAPRFLFLGLFGTGVVSWLWFWLKNAGVFGALALGSYIFGSSRERTLAAPFAALFFLANLGHIQPWSHDNVKLFAWVWLAFAPLVAGLLARAWAKDLAGKALAVQALALALATGTLALAREAQLESRDAQGQQVAGIRLLDSRAVHFADEVREKTPRDAVILTASNHNHPVPMLAGRTVALGYKGWLWPHGVDYARREGEVARIYSGKPDARALLERIGVGWIVVGPDERAEFRDLNERALAKLAAGPPFVSGLYHLYKVAP